MILSITSMHVISRSEIWGVNPLSTRFFSVPSRSGSVRGFKNSSNTGKRREQGRGIRSKHLLQSMIYRELRRRHPNYKVTMAATLQIWDPSFMVSSILCSGVLIKSNWWCFIYVNSTAQERQELHTSQCKAAKSGSLAVDLLLLLMHQCTLV